jgi:hypothetical protein
LNIVFVPKYRRKIFYVEIKAEIKKIVQLETSKYYKSGGADMSTREIEKVVLKTSQHNRRGGVTEPYPYASRDTVENECIKWGLKGKSSLIIHERHGNLKYKHRSRSFR